MEAGYRALLKLYPREYRERFGEEMAGVFAQAAEDCRRAGLVACIRFTGREYVGLLMGACRAWSLGTKLAPAAGGMALALVLHYAFLAAVNRVLRGVVEAAQRVPVPAENPLREAMTVGVTGVFVVLFLIPAFLLLRRRISWRSR